MADNWLQMLPQYNQPARVDMKLPTAEDMMKIAAFGDAQRNNQLLYRINALKAQEAEQGAQDTSQMRNYLTQQYPGVPIPIAKQQQQASQQAQMQQATEMFNKSIEAVMSGDSRRRSAGMAFLKQIAPGIVPQDLTEEEAPKWAQEVKALGDQHLPPQQTMQGLNAIKLKYAGDKEAQVGIKGYEENVKSQFGMSKVKGYDTPEEAMKVAQDMVAKAGKGAALSATFEIGPENKYIPKVVPNQQMRANIQVNVAGPKAEATETGRLKADFTALDKMGIKHDATTGKIDMNSVPATIRDTAKLVSEYRAPLPSSFALSRPYWQVVLAVASEMNPNLDIKEYPVRQALMRDFTSGNAAKNIRSINTAISHLDTFLSEGEKLSNRDFQTWNRLANKGATEFGDPRLNNFNVAATAIQNELAAVFKGTGATDQEIAQWRSSFMGSASPAQMKGAATTAWELLQGRINALQDQYDTGMGGATGKKILSPTAEKILEKRGLKKGEEASGTKSQQVGRFTVTVEGQ